MDELTSVLYTRETWGDLIGPIGRVDVHPPLYYIMQKVWLVFGHTPAAMRTLPVLLGTACIPVLFLIGRRAIGTRAGIVAAFLLTTAPLHVEQARQLRMYPLLTLATLMAIAGLVHALSTFDRDRSRSSGGTRWAAWSAYVAGAILAFYAHGTALLLPVLATFVVIALRLAGLATNPELRSCLWAGVAIALGIAPWMLVLHGHVMNTLGDFWIPEPTLRYVLGQFSGLLPYPRPVKVLFVLLCAAGLWTLRGRLASLWLVCGISAGQPLSMWVLSFVRPVLLIRAMVWPTALLMLLPAAALARLKRNTWIGVATAALVLLQALSLQAQYPPQIQTTEYADIVRPLVAFDPSRDRLVLAFQTLENGIRYEAPRPFDESEVITLNYGDRPEALRGFFRSRHVLRTELDDAVRGAGRVWLLTEISPKFPIPAEQDVRPFLDALAGRGRRAGRWESGNLALTLIELGRPPAVGFDSAGALP